MFRSSRAVSLGASARLSRIGATRFTTIMNPEQPNPAYAQMVVRVQNVLQMDTIMVEVGEAVLAAQEFALRLNRGNVTRT